MEEFEAEAQQREEAERRAKELQGKGPQLYYECKKNHTSNALALIDEGVPADFVDQRSGWTPLHWAASHGNVPVVKALLKANAAAAYRSRRVEESKGESEATPLHWAAYKGHLQVCWLLLLEGYSPDDADEDGNTSVHLSASAGHLATLRLLLDDGASVDSMNKHNNKPIDLAPDMSIRTLLHTHETEPQSASRAQMHQAMIQRYHEAEQQLQDALDAAKNAQEAFTKEELVQITKRLNDVVVGAQRVGVEEQLINSGQQYLKLLEVLHRLEQQSDELETCSPVKSQSLYEQFAVPLEITMKTAELFHVNPKHLQRAEELRKRAQAELRLELSIAKLQNVECAGEDHVRLMERLDEAIQNSKQRGGFQEQIQHAEALLERVRKELDIGRAIAALPTVKLPPPSDQPIPANYWGPEDKGHIVETETFPLPPPDTGEYVWAAAESFQSLRHATLSLQTALVGSEVSGANATLVADGKAAYAKVKAELEILEQKDAADKDAAVSAAQKAARKLKRAKKAKAKAK